MPTNHETQTAIHAKVAETYALAERLFDRTFPRPAVRFDIRGSSRNGYANSARNVVAFNLTQAVHNAERFLETTVVHECAHLLTRHLFGHHDARGRRIRPHGPEWAGVMRKLGAKPDRCSALEVAPVLLANRHAFYCACPDKTIHVGPRVAAKIRAGATYLCRACRTVLTPHRAPVIVRQGATIERAAADATRPSAPSTPAPSTPSTPPAAPSRPATPSAAMRQLRLF